MARNCYVYYLDICRVTNPILKVASWGQELITKKTENPNPALHNAHCIECDV
jgi:hypothetical protein